MRYYLAAVSGMHKGRLWPVEATGLLLGRDGACDICLMDPVVSRSQCRILLRDGQVRLEDAGGSNPALVNGAAVKAALLNAGDTVSLGRNLFLVTDDAKEPAASDGVVNPEPTAAWDKDSPVLLNIHEARQQVDLRPNSLSDLVFLYDVTRELSRQSSRNDFLLNLQRHIEECFHPQAYRAAFPYGEKEMAFYDMAGRADNDAGQAIENVARDCLKQGVGILQPGMTRRQGQKQRVFTMGAPMRAGNTLMGALVLQTHSPAGVFDEDDLKLLVLLAASAAPVLYTIENRDLLAQENARLRAISGESDHLVGSSRKMEQVRARVHTAARTTLNVLIAGETGTGKELAAHLLHSCSAQQNKPFVVVNCASLPQSLFESELFGYCRGAFTGAVADTPGLLSLAHGGILFLDEIGDLSLENQGSILRVVEQGVFRPLGGTKEIQLCIRVAAATNKNLNACIEQNTFRADLFHRLNGFGISMPPLREHREDIPALTMHFLEQSRVWGKHPVRGIAPEALALLRERPWPGNVRELRNCILRAVGGAQEDILQLRDFPDLPAVSAPVPPGEEIVFRIADMEKRHIKAVIDHCRGNLKTAAAALGIARSTLYNKISEYHIE